MAKIEDVNRKLDYLEETKNLIKLAIETKGQNIEETDTFREFVNKISNIRTKSTFLPSYFGTNFDYQIGSTMTMGDSTKNVKLGDFIFLKILKNKNYTPSTSGSYTYKVAIMEATNIEEGEQNNSVTYTVIRIFDEFFPKFISTNYNEKGLIFGNGITGQEYNWYSYEYSGLDITNADVLQGKQFIGATGIETGNMTNNGQLNFSPLETAQQIPAGYTSGGTISGMDITITSDYGNCLELSKDILGIE